MVALPLLTDPSQSIKDSRVPAAVADATQILPRQYGRTGLPYRIVVGCSGQEQSHRR